LADLFLSGRYQVHFNLRDKFGEETKFPAKPNKVKKESADHALRLLFDGEVGHFNNTVRMNGNRKGPTSAGRWNGETHPTEIWEDIIREDKKVVKAAIAESLRISMAQPNAAQASPSRTDTAHALLSGSGGLEVNPASVKRVTEALRT
jgi:hypothetical protein